MTAAAWSWYERGERPLGLPAGRWTEDALNEVERPPIEDVLAIIRRIEDALDRIRRAGTRRPPVVGE